MTPGTTAALYECGGIERPWTTGDNVSLAVGQGDLQATPLQLAEAYSTIINGGKVVRPHLGLQVEDGNGVLVEEIRTPIRRRVHFDPGYRDAIMAGLHGAATAAGGTSADVFAGFAVPQPAVRQDGHRRAPAEPRPVLVRVLRRRPDAADRGRHDDRARRLRRGDCGTRGAPDPQ